MKLEENYAMLLTLWCICHRLELAVQDTFSKRTFFCLNELFQAMKGTEELNDDEVDCPELNNGPGLLPLKAHSTRCLGHFVRALQRAWHEFWVLFN